MQPPLPPRTTPSAQFSRPSGTCAPTNHTSAQSSLAIGPIEFFFSYPQSTPDVEFFADIFQIANTSRTLPSSQHSIMSFQNKGRNKVQLTISLSSMHCFTEWTGSVLSAWMNCRVNWRAHILDTLFRFLQHMHRRKRGNDPFDRCGCWSKVFFIKEKFYSKSKQADQQQGTFHES